MSSLNEDQKWVPTHVQVTVLRGRGLRGKGKHGTSDVYTIIQLGKEKYSTCVVEKTTEPEWREECSFELQPGVLESSGRSGPPAGCGELILTVMHRAVIGLDVFLGQALIQLEKIFHETRCVKNEWYRLNSKTGKKEKERGDIQVSVQFTRNDLTASMYDLVMKDKSASTFGKLKERIKGKKRSNEEDTSAAVLPGGYGSLYRMRQRLPSDGGGEEDYEDDEGGEARRSKMRTFFLRGKLRKSSDTRSSTSLGSESSESSSRGGSLSPTAGISVVVSDLSNSPSNSSNLTADNSPEHIGDPSSLHCEFGDDTSEITIAVPELPLCVNGSHVDSQPVDSGRQGSLGLGLLQKSLPISTSLQNLNPISLSDLPKGAALDGRRWSFDKPGDEEKAAIAAELERREEDASSRQIPLLRIPSYSSVKETESQLKETSNSTEVKHRGWFGSKDGKPSLVVSPKLDRSTEPPSFGHSVDLVTPLHHTNPFCNSEATPPPLSSCNPFFPSLQQNPFYEDINSTQSLKPALPPLPFLSSARPPITQLFPQAGNTDCTLIPDSLRVQPIQGCDAEGDYSSNEEKQLGNWSDLFVQQQDLDESFDTFAAGRLNSPQETRLDSQERITTDVLANIEHRTDTKMNPFLNTNHDSVGTLKGDLFSFVLDTIPEDESFENNDDSPVELITKSTNTLTNTNKLSSRSPDPSTSGIGSSSEEDFLSCNSSYSASDKVSAYSSDEALDVHPVSAPEPSVIHPVNKSESEEETTDQSHEWASFDGLQSTVIQSPDVDKLAEEATQESVLTQPAVVPNGASGEVGHSVNISSVDSPDPLPELPVSSGKCNLQKSSVLPRFDNAEGEKQVSPPLQSSPDDIFSNHPSLFITTSSPDAKHRDSPLEGTTLESTTEQPGTFLEFPSLPGPDLENSLLHTGASEHSSALQSLYMSTDSQNFHSCHSNPFTSSFDVPEGQNSANSTLCGELIEIVDGTNFSLKDAKNQSITSMVEINLSKNPVVSMNQEETSQISQEVVPPEPTASWNPFAGILPESFEKPAVIMDKDLWGTSCGDIQQPESFGITADSKEISVKVTDNSATPSPTLDSSSFVDTWNEFGDEKPLAVHNKDVQVGPSDEMHQSESFNKTVDQTEPPEPNLKITSDLLPQEPPAMSGTLGSTSTQSVDVCDIVLKAEGDAEIQLSESSVTNELPVEASPKPNDSLNSSGGMLTVDKLDEDLCGNSTREIQASESFDMAVNQTVTSESSLFVNISDLDPQLTDTSTNLNDSLTGSEKKSVHEGDARRTPNEVSDSFSIATNERDPSEPNNVVTTDLFPQESAASSISSGELFTESFFEEPWGIQDNDPWEAQDNVTTEPKETRRPSFITLNDIIPFGSGGEASESVFKSPWGIQDRDPWSMPDEENQCSGFARDPSLTWPRVIDPKDFSDTSTNAWTESDQNPWDTGDDRKARNRSRSVGRLPARNKELPPLSEFESVKLQESSSSQPDLPSLTSFTPSLIPENGSFTLPSNSNTSARSPPDIVGTAVPAFAIAQPLQEVEQQQQEANQRTSPHPVKPLTSAALPEEKRGEGRSVLEILKSTISPGKNNHLSEQETERRKSLTGGAGSYYHLTHSELLALLVQREAELEKQKKEFQKQKTLLAKREVELKKLKPQVRDLEDYIDTLLVQIMEQKPTLLQVRSKLK